MQYEHPSESIPAYVLGALDADEAMRIRAHLASCADCRAEAESFHEVVGMLPYATAGGSPPAAVKRQLFARIAADEEVRRAPPPARPSLAPPAARQAVVNRRQTLSRFAAAGALALALGLGWVSLDSRQQLARVEQQLARSSSTVAALEQQVSQRDAVVADLEVRARQAEASVAALELEVSQSGSAVGKLQDQIRESEATIAALEQQIQSDEQIVSFIASPETVTRTIAATQRAGDASAQMYMRPGHNQVVLVVEGLPPPPPGSVYQLWLADESGQVAVGTLADQQQDVTRLLGTAPRPMETYAQVMVTVEPAAGAQGPSQDILFETSL